MKKKQCITEGCNRRGYAGSYCHPCWYFKHRQPTLKHKKPNVRETQPKTSTCNLRIDPTPRKPIQHRVSNTPVEAFCATPKICSNEAIPHARQATLLRYAREMFDNPTLGETMFGLYIGSFMQELLGLLWYRQYVIYPTCARGYIVDSYFPDAGLIIEIDGPTHFTHSAEIADAERTNQLQKCNFTVLRFTNREIHTYPKAVLHKIIDTLSKLDKWSNLDSERRFHQRKQKEILKQHNAYLRNLELDKYIVSNTRIPAPTGTEQVFTASK